MSPSCHAVKLLNKLYGYVFRRSLQKNAQQFSMPTLESLEPRLLLSSVYKIDSAALVEDNSGSQSAVFTVLRAGDTAGSSSVDYATADGTAAAGSDYGSTSGTLSFAAGQTSRTISVPVYGDLLNELNETFFVNLANPAGTSAIETAQGVGTIYNDDTTAAIKNVQRGSATFAATGTSTTVTLGTAVDLSKAFVLGSLRTDTSNPQEQVTYELTGATTLLLTRGDHSDTPLTVQWEVVEFSEGVLVQRGISSFADTDGTKNVSLTAVDTGKAFVLVSSRTASNNINLDERWTTQGRLTSGTNLELARHETGYAISVAWQVVEFTDTTTTVQSGQTSISDDSSSVTVTLGDEVDLQHSWLVFSRQAGEIAGGREGYYQVRGRLASSTTMVFDRATTHGSVDIAWFVVSMPQATVQSGTVSFAAATTQVDIDLAAVEPSLAATFVSAQGGDTIYKSALDDTSITTNLIDSDTLRLQRLGADLPAEAAWSVIGFDRPRLAFEAATSQADESIASWLIPVALSTPSGQTVTVNYAITGGTATSGVDFTLASGTLTFTAGQTRQFITLSITDDNLLNESDETLVISLSDPTNARLGTAANEPTSHTHTIINNGSPGVLALALDPTAIDENGAASVSGTFTDSGTQDPHVVTINWGDGSDATVLELAAGVRTFSAGHQYLDDSGAGTFTLSATVADNHGGSDTATTPITVANVAPSDLALMLSASEIDENGSTTLSGSFADVGTLDTHTVTINWGDGSDSTTIELAAGVAAFEASHQYLNDSGTGTFTISAMVADDGGSATATTAVTVANIAPSEMALTLSATEIDEGQSVTLGGSFADPGTLDAHTVVIDWGDGSDETTVELAAGVLSFEDVSHQYNSAGDFTINVTVADSSQASATASESITVNSTAPTDLVISLSDTQVDENGWTTLDFSFDDVRVEAHTVVVNWGDGSDEETIQLAAGVTEIPATAHQYLNEGQLPYVVAVTVSNSVASASQVAEVTVNNVAPSGVAVNLSASEIDEGGWVSVTGSFTDPGTLDTHTVVIAWGDGDTTTIELDAGVTSIPEALHQYLDDAGSPYSISATVTDTGAASANVTADVTVNNVAPRLQYVKVTSVDESGVSRLWGAFDHPETADTFTLDVDWGDGTQGSYFLAAGSTTFEETHQYLDNPVQSTYSVSFSLADDGGAISDSFLTGESTEIPTNGLVHWWSGDGHAADLVGTYDGSVGCMTGYDEEGGMALQAFEFNGDARSAIDFGFDSNGDLIASNFSISLWVKTSVTTGEQTIFSKRLVGNNASGGTDSTQGFWELRMLADGKLKLELQYIGGPVPTQTFSTSTGGFNNGDWHHVVATRQGRTATIYVDGQQAGTKTASAAVNLQSNSAKVLLGGSPADFIESSPRYNYFNGEIDEVLVYNRPLSGSEVVELFENVAGAKPPLDVQVRNVAPHDMTLGMQTDTNGTVTFTGSFIDPGLTDTHGVVIDWGDGTAATELSLAAGILDFHASHVYANNGTYVARLISVDDGDDITGPVGWWAGDLSGGQSTYVVDISSNGNDAQLIGASLVPGLFGDAISVGDNKVAVFTEQASQTIQQGPAGMTIDGWIYPTAAGTIFSAVRSSGGRNAVVLTTSGLDVSLTGAAAAVYAPAVQHTSYSGVMLNQWNYVAAVWDRTAGEVFIYINGELANSERIMIEGMYAGGPKTVVIGGQKSGSTYVNEMTGQIDELRFWNTALSQEEIQAVYADADVTQGAHYRYVTSDQVLIVNDADRVESQTGTNDGIPDFADGYNRDGIADNADDANASDNFVPLEFTIPEGVNLQTAQLKFTYDASAPLSLQVVGQGYNLGYQPDEGTLRLWTANGNSSRDGQTLDLGGQFLASGVEYDLSSFTPDANGVYTVYVEGIRPNQQAEDRTIKIEYVTGTAANETHFIAQVNANVIQDFAPIYGDSANAPGGVATGADGGNPMAAAYSGAVRLADGTVAVSSMDLASAGYGYVFGQTRTWTNDPLHNLSGGWAANGNGVVVSEMPWLVNAGTTIAAVSGGRNALYFDVDASGTFRERFFGLEGLAKAGTGANEVYVLTDTLGNQTRFYGFDTAIAAGLRGKFVSFTDPAGHVTTANYQHNQDSSLTVDVYRVSSVVRGDESWNYYYDDDRSCKPGQVSNVKLVRSEQVVQEVQYEYYKADSSTTDDDDGNDGDLKSAKILWGNNRVDASYYRYYTDSGNHNLKYVLTGSALDRLIAAIEGEANLDTATDVTIAPYADYYLEYGTDPENGNLGKVTSQTIQGAGGSSTGDLDATGAYTYSYDDANRVGFNAWKYDTIVTSPDQSETEVFQNFAGEVMLTRVSATGVSGVWNTFNEYDQRGRLILTASPSAVDTVNTTLVDLLGGTAVHVYSGLKNTAGVITISEYETTGAAGYLKEVSLRNGDQGTAVKQLTLTYDASDLTGTVHPVSTQKVYRNDDGTGDQTTTYTYTWVEGKPQVRSMTVTLPTVTAAENGSDNAAQTSSVFDDYGQAVWTKDSRGFLNYTAYDAATGAVTKTIADVDTTQTGDFSGLPSGWSTPAGGGAHLKTQIEVDGLGRQTKITDANASVTYIRYSDADNEVRTYANWDSTTHKPRGATQIFRTDRAGGYTESLSIVKAPALDENNLPLGTETFVAGDIRSLYRSFFDYAGQTVWTADYFNPSCYPALGTVSVNYRSSSYTYDPVNHQDTSTDSTGALTTVLYDGLGHTKQTKLNGALVASYTYAGPDADGVMLTSTAIQGTDDQGQTIAQTTTYKYDWRNRMTDSRGSDNVAQRQTANNLGETTLAQTYADADHDFVIDSTELRAQSEYFTDILGETYKTIAWAVDAVTGQLGGSLTSQNWFDLAGNLIKSMDPTGLFYKAQFDGLDRVIASFTSFDADETTYAQAANVDGDTIVSQSRTAYDGTRVSESQGVDAAGDPVATTKYFYDSDGDGTGTPTGRLTAVWNLKPKAILDNDDSDYTVTRYEYDDAGRQNVTISPDPDGDGPLTQTKSETTYDLAGRPEYSRTYKSDGQGGWTLLSQSQSLYNADGQLASTLSYNVEGGVAGHYLETTYTYDDQGRQVMVTQPGGAFTKTVYNAQGRVIGSYAGTAEGDNADPTNVIDDTIVSQSIPFYDDAGRVWMTATYQRNSDASGTGPLTTSNARVTYDVTWFDDAGRTMWGATFGTNGGQSIDGLGYDFDGAGAGTDYASAEMATRSGSGWDNWGEYLLTQYAYDGFGRNDLTTDNNGIETKTIFDDAGRRTHTVDNYDDFEVVDGVDTNTGDATDHTKDRVTKYVYNEAGLLTQQIALDANGDGTLDDNQTTNYVYAMELDAAKCGSPVYDGALLRATSYSDGSIRGDVITALNAGNAGNFITTTYKATGVADTRTDQNGTEHTYWYDDTSRLSRDSVTAVGTGIDDAVLAVVTTLDDLGRVSHKTSYDAAEGGNVVNDVQFEYDGWGNVVTAYQAHDGAVNTSTTPRVAYAYEDGAVGDAAKYVRLDSVTYPDGRVVYYNYADSQSDPIGAVLSRLDNVADNADGDDPYVKYAYIGQGTIVGESHPAVEGGLALSYGVADSYTGWDQFGRVVGQEWFGASADWTGDATGYQSDHQYAAAATGTAIALARWQFTDLPRGEYKVYVTWTADANAATDAPFAIYDGSVLLDTVAVDQTASPNDLTESGTSWELLGTYTLSGSMLQVRLTNEADGIVLADAVRIERIDPVLPTLTLLLEQSPLTEGAETLATITRSGSLDDELVVSLSSDDHSELTLPASVTIAAGQDSVQFTVTAANDTASDGTQAVTITASADGYANTNLAMEVLDDETSSNPTNSLAVSLADGSISETGSTTGTVTRYGSTSGDLVVTLSTSDDTEATVPATVTILDGNASATFTVTGHDDQSADDSQQATILASAEDYINGSATVTVTDVGRTQNADLTVTLEDSSISETGETTGTVTRSGSTSGDLVVNLSSGDKGEAMVPRTVTILDGQASATFIVTAVNDAVADGSQTATIAASADGYYGGDAELTITDVGAPAVGDALSVTLSRDILGENCSMLGTVTRSGSTAGDLIVSLSSSDTSEAVVPATVTILDGQTSATFVVTHMDDGYADIGGNAAVTITASADDYADGAAAATMVADTPAAVAIVDDGDADYATLQDGYAYTYDAAGNRTSRVNVLNSDLSEDYTNDSLNRLTDADRGGSNLQSWDLDAVGNWDSTTTDAGTETREHNAANEITDIDAGVTPTYDADGNMISGPRPGDNTTRQHYVHDAWNRLVAVYADDTQNPGQPGDLIASYEYDGQNYRISKTVEGDPDVTRDYYYNTDWQVLEVRVGGDEDPSEQFLWNQRYIDAAVVRFNDANTDGDYLDSGDSILYYTQDANYNITTLVDAATGAVVERYVYDPYGATDVKDAGWSDVVGNLSTVGNIVLYTGQSLDPESMLFLYRNRYYDAGLGRFASRDPAGFQDGMSLYDYVKGDPIQASDQTGLASLKSGWNQGDVVVCSPWFRSDFGMGTLERMESGKWLIRVWNKSLIRLEDAERWADEYQFKHTQEAWEKWSEYQNVEDKTPVPDVTQALDDLMKRLDRWWKELDDIGKVVVFFSRGDAEKGWDIREFGPGGKYMDKLVLVRGRTYIGSEVNYVLWGKMHALLRESDIATGAPDNGRWEQSMYKFMWAQKNLNPWIAHGVQVGTSDWAKAGYNGWTKDSDIHPRSEYPIRPSSGSVVRLAAQIGGMNIP